jgi:hypothetical protein
LKHNPDWAERRHDMNHFMARLIFCFFAEDTDIFDGQDLFTRTVDTMSERDGSNLADVMSTLFRAMDIRHEDRDDAELPGWAKPFPYVNGALFSGATDVPHFTKLARSYLIQAGNLKWKAINPDIFGSMIQAVADDDERGQLGMHYTSVPNILKVLNPLFLDDLRQQLEHAGDNARKLLNLRKRLAHIRVFDPACGSGNFLVIAYKEMRAIEAEINRRRQETHLKSAIPLTNFSGIELRDFAAEIARLALVIAEYQCDVIYRGQKEALKDVLPLSEENWITCGNALRLDWLTICPPTGISTKVTSDDLFEAPLDQAEIDFENEGGETYVCGNPPYLGAKKKSKYQSSDMSFVGLGESQLLDYVAAFIVKGLHTLNQSDSSMALVSTSSICQGEQVALLWPKILERAYLNFAYKPFRWSNSASNNAGVYCTILGLSNRKREENKLFSDDTVQICSSITPYLIAGPSVVCLPRNHPLSGLTKMVMGSNAVDGKRLIVERDEAARFEAKNPAAKKFLKKYGGTKELLSGAYRFCVWVNDKDATEAKKIPAIRKIIEDCREYRENAGRDARKAAKRPHAFCYSSYENRRFIQVGNTIGNSLSFIPTDLKEANFVSNHNAFTLYDASLVEFSIITSTLHRIWADSVGGRLGNGTRYGNTTVYNTFPVPALTEQNKADLIRCAEDILLAREAHFPATIADLYKPDAMPDDLRHAHERNDEVLERIYIGRRFKNDTERLEKLFEMYAQMTASENGRSGDNKRKATHA